MDLGNTLKRRRKKGEAADAGITLLAHPSQTEKKMTQKELYLNLLTEEEEAHQL